ncbi:unnamed protein product [Spirodela intermedia]|uniref:Uncharacterized protein n=1 Tax=Spirodela intermedia TaxID=51605 RepID=A0A7I8KRD6_SPIIN|nr:unnamed protein product [Spirodela intermedia]
MTIHSYYLDTKEEWSIIKKTRQIFSLLLSFYVPSLPPSV